MKPIAILYEHPDWFTPLFAELERRQLPHERLLAHDQRFDPSARTAPYSLVVNRVSPSSYLRGHTSAIFHARQYLGHLEQIGVRVVNGARAFALETSKARQLMLLAGLGLPHPKSRVLNHLSQVEAAASELRYPLILKPNIGGSGALMRRFDTSTELEEAVACGELLAVFGLDHTAIIQEYHPPKGGSIVRVEALDNRLLYAIRIHSDPGGDFNLCPADICQLPGEDQRNQSGGTEDFGFCPVDTGLKKALAIELARPPTWVVDAVLQVFRAASIDIGGVEYLESERDGQVYLYDINALSNFVTNAPALLGFDPFQRFVDYLERRTIHEPATAPS